MLPTKRAWAQNDFTFCIFPLGAIAWLMISSALALVDSGPCFSRCLLDYWTDVTLIRSVRLARLMRNDTDSAPIGHERPTCFDSGFSDLALAAGRATVTACQGQGTPVDWNHARHGWCRAMRNRASEVQAILMRTPCGGELGKMEQGITRGPESRDAPPWNRHSRARATRNLNCGSSAQAKVLRLSRGGSVSSQGF